MTGVWAPPNNPELVSGTTSAFAGEDRLAVGAGDLVAPLLDALAEGADGELVLKLDAGTLTAVLPP